MSSAENKVKVQLDPKFIIKLTGTLLGICAVVSTLLGVVNHFTKPIIDEAKAAKTNAAMAQVLEAETYNKVECATPGVVSLNEAMTGGEQVGYVVEVAPSGFGGAISMAVGVDTNGTVTGVAVINQKETPNVGTKVVGNQSVLDRFIGMSHEKGDITVNSGANCFDGVSGATVSSKGVTAGVNTALTAVEECKGGNN